MNSARRGEPEAHLLTLRYTGSWAQAGAMDLAHAHRAIGGARRLLATSAWFYLHGEVSDRLPSSIDEFWIAELSMREGSVYRDLGIGMLGNEVGSLVKELLAAQFGINSTLGGLIVVGIGCGIILLDRHGREWGQKLPLFWAAEKPFQRPDIEHSLPGGSKHPDRDGEQALRVMTAETIGSMHPEFVRYCERCASCLTDMGWPVEMGTADACELSIDGRTTASVRHPDAQLGATEGAITEAVRRLKRSYRAT